LAAPRPARRVPLHRRLPAKRLHARNLRRQGRRHASGRDRERPREPDPRSLMAGARASSSGLLVLLGLPGLALPAAEPQATRPEKPPAFPARIELVTVDVVAVDKSGHAVAGLGRGDFTVLED